MSRSLREQAHELTVEVYRASAGFPEPDLAERVRRAFGAVELALREGADVANGKLAAAGYLLLLSRDLGYLTASRWRALRDRVVDVGKKLRARAFGSKAGPGRRSSLKRA